MKYPDGPKKGEKVVTKKKGKVRKVVDKMMSLRPKVTAKMKKLMMKGY